MKVGVSEILVVGGGVIGLGIARELHKRGVGKITLLEKSVCGQESSWAAAGMLGPQAEADEEGPFFEMCSASRDMYPDFAAELLDETGVDIELDRTGTLYLAFTEDDIRDIRKRFAWQQRAGMEVEQLLSDDVRRIEPLVSTKVRKALYFPNDWQVDNRKLLKALMSYATLNDIEVRNATTVEGLNVEKGRVTGVETAVGRIEADTTVLATGAWTSLIKLGPREMPFMIDPIRGQIIAFQASERLFRHVIYSRRGYIVPRMDGRLLAGSTSENVGFDKSLTDSAAKSLREMANEIAPELAGLEITDQWAGLRPAANDEMPIIGEFSGLDGLFVATAHYRNGILLAPFTATLAAERLLNGTESAYYQIFGPDRFRPRVVGKGI